MRDTIKELAAWLEAGGSRAGQVLITACVEGWELRHVADAGATHLPLSEGAAAARALANLDEQGAYRPLKTAPNLRRGWRLLARNAGEVGKALDAFYPAMLGVWLARRAGELPVVHLRETLGRQSGMYRVTQKLTDEQAQELIGCICEPRRGCLKTILWQIAPDRPIASLPPEKFTAAPGGSLPLLCHEACNILVAGARKMVKGEAL